MTHLYAAAPGSGSDLHVEQQVAEHAPAAVDPAELALADQRVEPARLNDLGHHFRYPTLTAALKHELGKETYLNDLS